MYMTIGEVVRRLKEAGPDALLFKPVSVEQLVNAAAACLKKMLQP